LHCGSGCVDVVVNGNRALADAAVVALGARAVVASPPPRRVRVWFIPFGDKAHAWNHYVRLIWPGSDVAFFIDGYTRMRSNSFDAIVEGMRGDDFAWAGSGVPTHGRSAKRVRDELLSAGGFAGNLGAIRGDVLRRMVDSGFGLPIGLYRVDSVIGAVLMFSLDPANNPWNPKRVHVAPNASWDYDPLKWWRLDDLRTHLRRRKRQTRGDLENAAVRHWMEIEKRAPHTMPETIAQLIEHWRDTAGEDVRRMMNRGKKYHETLQEVLAPRDWSAAKAPPVLLGERAID
jgi:hypothetical protein